VSSCSRNVYDEAVLVRYTQAKATESHPLDVKMSAIREMKAADFEFARESDVLEGLKWLRLCQDDQSRSDRLLKGSQRGRRRDKPGRTLWGTLRIYRGESEDRERARLGALGLGGVEWVSFSAGEGKYERD